MEQLSTDNETRAVLAAWQRAYTTVHGNADLPDAVATIPATERAGADAQAAWRRWHDEHTDALFAAREWPWYAVLERARVETLAGRQLPGMRSNLEPSAALLPIDEAAGYLYQAARRIFAGEAPSASHRPPPLLFAPAPASSLTRRVVDRLKRRVTQEGDSFDIDANVLPTLRQAVDHLRDAAQFAQSVTPLVRAIAARRSVIPTGSGGLARSARSAIDERAQNPAHRLAPDAAHALPGSALPADNSSPDADGASTAYRVFSRKWDEELLPRQLENLLAGRSPALPEERENRTTARRLAHRLQRRLVAARLRRWDFDQEEGAIDNKRLAALYTGTGNRRVFRLERESPVPEACVCLLLDQSGSMRGAPLRMTLDAIDLAVQALETCGIACEVLGYTTRFGNDNPLVRAWQDGGSSASPGRLNAVRHVVYKTASQPGRRARRYFSLALDMAAGGENIDGEALEWAANRLLKRPEPRRILVVLSDGTPYDAATARANGRDFLEAHLRSVIARIESTPIHLAAIGAGQDVGRYYRHALTLRRPADVSDTLFRHLADLLTGPA